MSSSDPYLGKSLGSFQVEKQLGAGAMGVVYLAVHETTQKKVAIKILPQEAGIKGQVTERFHREANLLQQFKHPNIVRFQAFGRTKGTLYVAMELVEGGTLSDLISREAPLDWRTACKIAVEICDALQYAHDREVVHRDLKPSNLLMTTDGHVKLSDFGIAKDLVGTELTGTGRTLGTAAYMAPEQITGNTTVSHKTDLYALGVIMHQLMTKNMPFEANSQTAMLAAHLNAVAPRVSKKNPEIPMVLDDLVHSMLQKAPSERPWDALAIATQLRELLQADKAGKSIKYVVKPGQNPMRAGSGDIARKSSKSRSEKIASTAPKIKLEVVGLILALSFLLGFIGYVVWPPSAEYLHAKAAELMKTDEYTNWLQAMNRYIEPLEKRFPQNVFQDEIRIWKDKIELTRAERRAEILDRSTIASLAKPNGTAESLYARTRELAAPDISAKAYRKIAGYWVKMAEVLQSQNATESDTRGWVLLAEKKANSAKLEWQAEYQFLLDQKKKWMEAQKFGSPDDEKTHYQNLMKALSSSSEWNQTSPEEFPVNAVFEPLLPSPGSAN